MNLENLQAVVDGLDVLQTYSEDGMEPKCADAYFNRGYIKSEKQDKRGAIADYNQVITIDPDYADAYVERVISVVKRGIKRKQLQILRKQ